MAKTEKISFGAFHKPALESGEHTLELTQTIGRADPPPNNPSLDDPAIVQDPYISTIHLFVAAERYVLPPKEIYTVFPPTASLGDFSNVLPHIVLRRSTLPWERHAQNDQKDAPWLALLVFQEGELVPTDTAHKDQASHGFSFNLSEIRTQDSLNAAIQNHDEVPNSLVVKGWTDFAKEPGEDPKDRALLLFTTRETLESQLPTQLDTLAKCAHIRIGQGEEIGSEKAVIMGHRLPQPQANCVVHLVSLENRYVNGTFDYGAATGDDDVIALMSLKRWTFSCLSSRHNFRGLMLHLNHTHLFNMDTSSTVRQQLDKKEVPEAISDHLKKLGVVVNKLRVVDKAKHLIKEKDHVYIFSEDNKLYDQAGLFLHQLHRNFSRNESILKKTIDTINVITEKATILEYPSHFYWWLKAKGSDNIQHTYVIGIEGNQLYVVKLSTDETPNLRLPATGHADADAFLNHGMVPLPHYFRQGSQSVSWYRGPLSPVEMEDNIPKIEDIQASDQLLRYHKNVGLFEVSYAAAFELGRLLTLKQKAISTKLDRWKRVYHRAQKKQVQAQKGTHLSYGKVEKQKQNENQTAIEQWFTDLIHLAPIPYNYLVPDEGLLPKETIRFFHVDRSWLAYLLLGAYSLGRPVEVSSVDHLLTPAFTKIQWERTGFLLRSNLVSGWPDLIISGKDAQGKSIELEVRRQVTKNTLLCIFLGNPQKITFSLKPETMHFGFHQDELEDLI